MNIATIYEEHYLPEKSAKRAPSTVSGYDSSTQAHVIPRWGMYEIEEIDPDGLQEWVDEFSLPGAAEKAFKCLRQIIRWWIKKQRLHIIDPTVYIELPAKPAYRPEVLEASELAELQRGFWGHELEAFLLIDSSLGARRGEACAVDYRKDINLKTGEVRLGKSRQCIRGEIMTVSSKTPKSNRTAYLPRYVLQRLRQICKGKTGLVIGDMSPDTVARHIKAHCKKLGLPHVSLTNLRHTWATLAIEAGVGIETVAMMLGHTDISTSYNHYIVPRKSICQDAQAAVASLIMSSAPKPRHEPRAAQYSVSHTFTSVGGPGWTGYGGSRLVGNYLLIEASFVNTYVANPAAGDVLMYLPFAAVSGTDIFCDIGIETRGRCRIAAGSKELRLIQSRSEAILPVGTAIYINAVIRVAQYSVSRVSVGEGILSPQAKNTSQVITVPLSKAMPHTGYKATVAFGTAGVGFADLRLSIGVRTTTTVEVKAWSVAEVSSSNTVYVIVAT